MGIDAIVSLVGLIAPTLLKTFSKKTKTQEEILGDLSPPDMAAFVSAQSSLLDAQTKFYNRDVVGDPAKWVSTLRAAIRPCTVVAAMCLFALTSANMLSLDPGTRIFLESCVASWFGSRIS